MIQTLDPNAQNAVAVLFPGHGSPYSDMGVTEYDQNKTFRDTIDEANATLAPLFGTSIEKKVFTREGATAAEIEGHLLRTDVVQPLILAFDVAYYRLGREMGLNPHALLGHSVGEMAAAVVAGMLSFEQGLRAMFERGKVFRTLIDQAIDTGGMVAVKASRERVEAALKPSQDFSIACINSPNQVVIAGSRDGITRASRELETQGIGFTLLGVEVAWHSPLAQRLGREALFKIFSGLNYQPHRIPILCNVDLDYYSPAHASQSDFQQRVVKNFTDQVGSRLDFVSCVEKLYQDGVRVFVEAGPRRILSGFVTSILGKRPYVLIPYDQKKGARNMLKAVG